MQKVIKHASTRWLSLQKCAGRTISQWQALKSYFVSHEDVEKPGRVKKIALLLQETGNYLYMLFLHYILRPLNKFNTLFQSEIPNISVLHSEMTSLVKCILSKFVKARVIKDESDITKDPFQCMENQLVDNEPEIGTLAKQIIQQCQSLDLNVDTIENEQAFSLSKDRERKFYQSVQTFYTTLVTKFLEKFPLKNSFLHDIKLLEPSNRLDLTADVVCRLANVLPVEMVPTEKRDQLREEFTDWQLLDDDMLPKYSVGDQLDTYWASVAKIKANTGGYRYEYLPKLAKALLTIPPGNAGSERTFSMVRKIDTEFRSELGHDTIYALLSVKINSYQKPSEFNPSQSLLRTAKSATYMYNKQHKANK